MQYQAVLSNTQHPEYGMITVPFPIPAEQYDEIIEMLHALEIGDPMKRDCKVDEISDGWPILKRLEKVAVNVDEMDYLAKRLDSYTVGEDAQFQGMAAKLGIFDMTDFINLSFCCQLATVVSDFSDLNKVGHEHAMNLNGGAMPTEEYNKLDGRKVAMALLREETGTITPFGVVYDNGMRMESLYDGRHFPAYSYEPSIMDVTITPKDEPENSKISAFLQLPVSQTQIERTMLRAGISSYDQMRLYFESSQLPDEIDALLDFEHENLGNLNLMCKALSQIDSSELPKLAAVALMAKPQNSVQVANLAEQLEFFDFIPNAKTPEDYGKYMIQESGHFEYDENLEDFYNYSAYGAARMQEEYGQFNFRGYVSYHGTMTLEELMAEDASEQPSYQMGGVT